MLVLSNFADSKLGSVQRAGGGEVANKNSCATWEGSAYCKGTVGVGLIIADN